MKQQILAQLHQLINAPRPITSRIEHIERLREILDTEQVTDIERTELNYAVKTRIQQEASETLTANYGDGVILIATGGGKSKIAINRIKDAVDNTLSRRLGDVEPRFLIVVPTQNLRDSGWREEFEKWNALNYYTKNVMTVCYDSLHSMKGYKFDCVYFDEIHNITEANMIFFEDNVIGNKVGFTATRPRNKIKIELLRSLNLNPIYEITLDQAVSLGLVAPYDITIVELTLDNVDKIYKAGNATKSWMQTEAARYAYATSRIMNSKNPAQKKMAHLSRMRLLYETKTKTDAAQYILDNIIPKEQRTLIFAGGINQALQLCDHRYYSKPSISKTDKPETRAAKQIKIDAWKGDTDLIRFEREEISRLSCVSSLNEGRNINNLDNGFMPQIDSNQLNLIQRLGRIIRFRVGHTGRIIILCVKNTIDENWVNTAVSNLAVISIKKVTFEDLKSGKETISFT